jgi:hypothetical protein
MTIKDSNNKNKEQQQVESTSLIHYFGHGLVCGDCSNFYLKMQAR